MENINSQNPIDKIEFLIKNLIDFSNENKFDFALYKSFANESSKAFNRYFALIDNKNDKAKIISDFETDFHFKMEDMVVKMMATKDNNQYPSDGTTYYITPLFPDSRIRGYESNYKQLIELFLNSVEFDIKPQTKPGTENKQGNKNQEIENSHNEIFVGSSFEIWQAMFDKFQIEKSKRTDVNFMFEVMKYNNLIHKNVGYKYMQDWINEVYQITMDKITFTDHKTSSNSKRLIIYNEIVSK